jgi:DNA replication initiation complex subunit (GINS family)
MENGTRKEERRSEGSQSAPSFQETRQEKNEEKKEAPITTDSNTGTEKIEAKKENDAKTVRFISAFPRFLGTNLEEYGPFMEEDITVLPVKIADVLVKKKRAEEIAAK